MRRSKRGIKLSGSGLREGTRGLVESAGGFQKSMAGFWKSGNGKGRLLSRGERIYSYIGYGSLGLLLLLSLATILPVCHSESQALDTTGYGEMRANVNIAPVVSVAMQSAVDVDVVPKQNGSYAMSVAKLTVATNSDNGYSVYIKSGSQGSNSLTSTDATNAKEIKATTKTGALTTMENNAWGYALSTGVITEGSSFSAVPTEAGSAIATTDKDSVNLGSGNSYNLAFGVNVDTTLPAGQYTGSVIVSAVANPITVTSLYQLTYMQDMTPEICANTAYADGQAKNEQYKMDPVTKQLIDTRDGSRIG